MTSLSSEVFTTAEYEYTVLSNPGCTAEKHLNLNVERTMPDRDEPPPDPRTNFEAFKDAAVLVFTALMLIQFFIWVDPREYRELGDDGSCEVSESLLLLKLDYAFPPRYSTRVYAEYNHGGCQPTSNAQVQVSLALGSLFTCTWLLVVENGAIFNVIFFHSLPFTQLPVTNATPWQNSPTCIYCPSLVHKHHCLLHCCRYSCVCSS